MPSVDGTREPIRTVGRTLLDARLEERALHQIEESRERKQRHRPERHYRDEQTDRYLQTRSHTVTVTVTGQRCGLSLWLQPRSRRASTKCSISGAESTCPEAMHPGTQSNPVQLSAVYGRPEALLESRVHPARRDG